MNIFELANLLAQLIVGRNPAWSELSIPNDGAAVPVSVKGRPLDGNSGVGLNGAPKTMIDIRCREDVARYGNRIRIATLDDTADYTVTINSLDHAVTATSGQSKTDVLDAIEELIDDGVSITTGDLTFGGGAGVRTITRASGDWTADGATAGTQILITGTVNAGRYTIKTVDSATQVTLVSTDDVTAGTESPTTVKLREQVTAAVEDRGGVPTLVVKVKHGSDQEPDDVLAAANLSDETTTFTVTLAATGTGEMEYDKDATTATVKAFLYPDGKGDKPPGWSAADKAEFTVTDENKAQRLSTAGSSRVDATVSAADGIVRIFFGPAAREL